MQKSLRTSCGTILCVRIIEDGMLDGHNLFQEDIVAIVDDTDVFYVAKPILHEHIREWIAALHKYALDPDEPIKGEETQNSV